MIRPTVSDDVTAILALADAIGFQPSELEELRAMLADYFRGDRPSDCFWIIDDTDGPVGVAYCEPEQLTHQTWNLQFIAIRPDKQGQGNGTALLHDVEQRVAARGGRMLLIETSSLPGFERTRRFYATRGYEEEARIRDFYTTGEDKVVFRKVLSIG